jgi:type VI secretion system secreted protein Hcp
MPTAVEQKIFAGTHSDYFFKMGDLKGESQDAGHKGEISVNSWNFGCRQPGASAVAGAGAGAGKVQFSDIEVTKYLDSATPKIMAACASGQHFADATLVCRKAGGTQVEYFTVKLTNVLISSYETVSNFEGSGSGTQFKDALPVDKFTLNFAKIDLTYVAQDEKGQKGASTMAGWDLKTGQKS